MRWAGHAENMGERKTAYKILVRKLGGKKLPGIDSIDQWEDIRMNLKRGKVGQCAMDLSASR
jgi:hypothetical protein